MDVLIGALHVVAAVIIVGGVAKVVAPDAFASLLRSLGLPSDRSLARATGVLEVVLGSAAVLAGGRWAAAVIASVYGVFAVTILLARRAGASSCGCFGVAAAPPGPVHVVVNLTSAAIALAAALVADVPSLASTLTDQPLAGVPYLLTVATGAWLAVTLDTVGAVVFDRMASLRAVRPTIQANSTSTHVHAHAGGTRR
jgi:uncharacterized membrane protein YphA (DoxX/SURF4 family)